MHPLIWAPLPKFKSLQSLHHDLQPSHQVSPHGIGRPICIFSQCAKWQQMISWLDYGVWDGWRHVVRMRDERLPMAKQLLFSQFHNAQNAGPGPPQKSWQDYVREDSAKVNISYNWFNLAQEREVWRSRIKRLLVHYALLAQGAHLASWLERILFNVNNDKIISWPWCG